MPFFDSAIKSINEINDVSGSSRRCQRITPGCKSQNRLISSANSMTIGNEIQSDSDTGGEQDQDQVQETFH